MNKKILPFTKEKIEEIIKEYPTPFHIYDEKGIRENAKKLIKAFSIFPYFKEYFAVKANPNPQLIKIFKEIGFGLDCSSMAELIIAERSGITGENIMFTSNDTPVEEFIKAKDLGAIINLDDITHIDFYEKYCGIPELICFRYNPGYLREGNAIIGKPEEAKYGLTKTQLFEAYNIMKNKGTKRFGLHTMIVSNELNPDYFIETGRMLFELIVEITEKVGIRFEFVNLGGGLGIPYKPDQKDLDIFYIANGIKKHYDNYIEKNKLSPLKIFLESGRYITGPYGYLITKAIHYKNTYKNYIGVDACMAHLMRPAIYGAYHHITVLGKENNTKIKKYDIVGSLCENNDKFAIDRELPEIEIDDILVIHDTGAHGYAMGFNYNGKLRCKEILLKNNGSVELIRRSETIDDYLATVWF